MKRNLSIIKLQVVSLTFSFQVCLESEMLQTALFSSFFLCVRVVLISNSRFFTFRNSH